MKSFEQWFNDFREDDLEFSFARDYVECIGCGKHVNVLDVLDWYEDETECLQALEEKNYRLYCGCSDKCIT